MFGLDIRTNSMLTEPGEPIEVKRTWRERLLTLPWRPLQATRTFTPQVPSRQICRVGNTLVCHPIMYEEIKQLYMKQQPLGEPFSGILQNNLSELYE